jgi:hypothetical protein
MEDFETFARNRLEKILVQTTITNGRVNKLESEMVKAQSEMTKAQDIIEKLVATDNQTKGRDKVLWILIGVVGTVALAIAQHFFFKS